MEAKEVKEEGKYRIKKTSDLYGFFSDPTVYYEEVDKYFYLKKPNGRRFYIASKDVELAPELIQYEVLDEVIEVNNSGTPLEGVGFVVDLQDEYVYVYWPFSKETLEYLRSSKNLQKTGKKRKS